MAFVDAWFGAVQAPLRGTLVTFDAGASWRPVGMLATNIEAQGGELVLTGPGGVVSLDRTGTFSRREALNAPRDAESAVAPRARPAPASQAELHSGRELLARRALKLAVLRGFRDRDGTFVVASSGSLLRVRPEDGKILASDEHAYPGSGECTALPLGIGFGFVCSASSDTTTLFAFQAPFALRSVRGIWRCAVRRGERQWRARDSRSLWRRRRAGRWSLLPRG